jgi:alpha-methylacyl-CoA racemase
MVDGASLLMTLFHGRRMMGTWNDERGTNYVDGGAPFYNVYQTSDHRHVAIGPIEPKFQQALFDAIGVDLEGIALPVSSVDRAAWPELRHRFNAYETADGWVSLLCPTQAHWERLCTQINDPATNDPRFATMAGRCT